MRTMNIPMSSLRASEPNPPSGICFLATAGIAVLLGFGFAPVQADNRSQGAFDHWGAQAFALESCAGVLERSEDGASAAAGCVRDRAISGLFNIVFGALDQHGKSLFGEHFYLEHHFDYSAAGGGASGELDAVIPINSFTSVAGERVTQALFLQNGVSSWRDEHGIRRNDMRFGVVYRTAMFERSEAGVWGTSVFFQQNAERGHERIVTGLDYSGWWGSGSLNYFMPTTDWRDGRLGHEERAIEGVEFELRTHVTDVIELSAATGHWEDKDGVGDWITRGRLGLRWQPHPWLGLQGNWEHIGTADDSLGLHAVVAIPFGARHAQQGEWRGFGRRMNMDAGNSGPGTIWNSVDNVGRIEVAERQDSSDEDEDEFRNVQPEPSFNQMNTGV